jgi:hypothetical protein
MKNGIDGEPAYFDTRGSTGEKRDREGMSTARADRIRKMTLKPLAIPSAGFEFML